MKREYETPVLRDIGTISELTAAFNKVGHKADIYTAATGGAIVGSLVPVK